MHIHLEGDAWNIMFPPEKQFSEDDLDFEDILFPYLANGITTVQVMSALPEHIALRERIKSGEILGPRLILNRMVDGVGEAWPPPINTQVATPEEARQIVIDSKDAGYDGMKVYNSLDQECYNAILTTAKKLDMPVVGHIPNALSVEHILGAGQNLIAHSEEVMKHTQGDFSSEKIEYFAEIIAKSKTWATPTLTTSRKILALFDDLDAQLSRPEMRFLHPMARGVWSYLIENIYLKIPPEHRQFIRQGFNGFQRPFTKALYEKGIKLMTGTDVLIPVNLPGFSLHDELQEFVDVGLTPYEALRTSTTHPVDYLGELDDTGTLEIGKRAELVLLEANPLDDIANAKKIMGVLCIEQWLDREEIQGRMDNLHC
ncbi:MAG: amidohydrolase family protein [Anaerolineae bacterium]|jgi:imidazolonepropionase-like amidohydrolase|nr:amidohydrolase family protein [Anaerolineae bacterium]MBT7015687.1 amidohydrolase family protein [Anaerolineae bacterium]